jgi:predicted HTH domain antitoxin
MVNEFKDELKRERVTLKRTFPTLDIAKDVFNAVDNNREHLVK